MLTRPVELENLFVGSAKGNYINIKLRVALLREENPLRVTMKGLKRNKKIRRGQFETNLLHEIEKTPKSKKDPQKDCQKLLGCAPSTQPK